MQSRQELIKDDALMNGVLKGMLSILLIIYFVSPVDLCPGPVDDIILLLCAVGGGALSSVCDEGSVK